MSQNTRRFALDYLDRFVDVVLRVNFNQHMHVIWHDFHCDDTAPISLHAAWISSFYEDFAPLYRTPNHMIFA
jgi:hypothetical protein